MSDAVTAHQIVTAVVERDTFEARLALSPVRCIDCETFVPLGWIGVSTATCHVTRTSHRASNDVIVHLYDLARNANA